MPKVSLPHNSSWKGRGFLANSIEEIEAEMMSILIANDMYFQDVMKYEIQEVIQDNVYNSYSPVMNTRRGSAGGLADIGNIKTFAYAGGNYMEISAHDDAKWQHLNRKHPIKLDRAIESGESMHGAGGRPFYSDAEEKCVEAINDEVGRILSGEI